MAGSREGRWTDPRRTGAQDHGGTRSAATEPSCPCPAPSLDKFCREHQPVQGLYSNSHQAYGGRAVNEGRWSYRERGKLTSELVTICTLPSIKVKPDYGLALNDQDTQSAFRCWKLGQQLSWRENGHFQEAQLRVSGDRTYRSGAAAGAEGSRVYRRRAAGAGPRAVLTPLHSTPILTSSPPSGPLSYLTVSTVRLSRLRRFSEPSGSPSTSATLCL